MHTLTSPLKGCMRFLNSTWIKAAYILPLTLLIIHSAHGQGDLVSPYSVLGPGLPYHRVSAHQVGMGSAGAAMFDLYRMNLINPAVASMYTEPIFDMAGASQLSTFESGGETFENSRFVLNNISLAFPIKRNQWSLYMGLVPATKVSYNFTATNDDNGVGRSRATYEGNGGISNPFLGTGFKVWSRQDTANNQSAISLGVQYNYFFGPIDNNRRILLLDEPAALGTAIEESFLVRAHGLEFGAHYHTNIIKRSLKNPRYLKLLLGAVYRVESDLNAERSNYTYNFRPTVASGVISRDTVFQSTRSKGSIHMPQALTLGMGLDYFSNSRKRIRLALDYRVEQWSNYTQQFDNTEVRPDFENLEQLSVGIEYSPSLSSNNFFKRLEYRAGFRTAQMHYKFDDIRLQDRAVSAGLSIPVNQQRNLTQSRFNLSAEYGSFGTTDNGLVSESYVRILAGFSLTPHFRNRWFVKPKYD